MFIRRTFRTMAVLLLGAFAMGAPTPASAGTAATPEVFINGMAEGALQTLKDKASQPEMEQRFGALLNDDFDMPRISRFVLGRYWMTASDQEKQQFQKIFETYVVRAYSNRFSQYSGQTVKVDGARDEGDNSYVVTTDIVSPQGGDPIKVDWRVHKTGDDYRITDVAVEGVSMVLTQKQEFAAVIERTGNGVAGLNAAIQAKLNGTATAQQ